MGTKRSRGITIIGIYCIIGAAIGFIIFYGLFRGLLRSINETEYATRDILYLSGFLIQSILYALFGYKLLNMKNWARRALIYFNGVLIVLGPFSLINAVTFEPRIIVSRMVPIVTSLLVIFYLTRSKVKEQFK